MEYLALREGVDLPARPSISGEAAAAASDESVAAVAAATAAFEAASLISSNDTLEDVSTRSLCFIMLPFMAAAARIAWQGDVALRLEAVSDARKELMAFFHRVDALGMLGEADRDRMLDDMPELVQTPQERRETLIARHMAEKVSGQRLETLLARHKTHSNAVVRTDGEDDGDEEIEREGVLAILGSAVRRAMDAMTSVDRELEVLRYAVASLARGVDPAKKAAQERPRGKPEGMNGILLHAPLRRRGRHPPLRRPAHARGRRRGHRGRHREGGALRTAE